MGRLSIMGKHERCLQAKCWRWEGEKGTDLPGRGRKHQVQKCPFALVLQGEQAPGVALPLPFSVSLCWAVVRKAGGEELGGGGAQAMQGLSPVTSAFILWVCPSLGSSSSAWVTLSSCVRCFLQLPRQPPPASELQVPAGKSAWGD